MPQFRQLITRWCKNVRLGQLLAVFLMIWLSFTTWAIPPASAFNAPELLPDRPTPVIDLARALTTVQEEKLVADLNAFESETGWKLRVLTQFDRTPGLAIRDFWGLDQKSILLIADSRGGNLLNFNVGDAVYPMLPRVFWVELQTRFGNQFFVRDNGEDQSILQALASIETCLQRGGCQAVPGLPREQWILTLVTSILGGVIMGFAARPRHDDQLVAWQWALIFSPLWGMLFISFGIGPVVSRTSDWLPLFRNFAGFAIGALAAFLVPIFGPSSNPET